MEEQIINILKKYTFDDKLWANYSQEKNLKNDLLINSARIVDIVLDLEEKFNIEISDDEIEKMKTIKDIIEIVSTKTK